jgi:hypothetical protein
LEYVNVYMAIGALPCFLVSTGLRLLSSLTTKWCFLKPKAKVLPSLAGALLYIENITWTFQPKEFECRKEELVQTFFTLKEGKLSLENLKDPRKFKQLSSEYNNPELFRIMLYVHLIYS